jgi:FkbM family methyltransferase
MTLLGETWEGLVKTKACRHGLFHYFPHDIYVGRSLDLYGEFAEQEARLFQQVLPAGGVVVEAGANIGALTVPIAKRVGPTGRVLAYEPQPVIAALLARNRASNQLAQIEICQAALGAAPGQIALQLIEYRTLGNFGGVALGTGAAAVLVETIDARALARVDLIKIDVEGMECDVLAGARATIARTRPVLYVENDRAEHSHRLIALLQALGYRLWWHSPPLFNPNNAAGLADNVFGTVMTINLFCLPQERGDAVTGSTPVLGPGDTKEAARARLTAG